MVIRYIDTNIMSDKIALTAEIRSVGTIIFSSKKNDIGWLYHININDEWRDYYVIYVGPVDSEYMPVIDFQKTSEPIPVRIDSGCMTGMTFGDKSCECKKQLDKTLLNIRDNKLGFVIHIPSQDGRGMGIDFKLQTLRKQFVLGLNTVDAAKSTSESDFIDRRTYHGAIACMDILGLDKNQLIDIATNNPNKINSFINGGYHNYLETRVIIKPTKLTEAHLKAKKEKLGHALNSSKK